MKERVKILIGYDGSECADAAIDDLRRAGLPEDATAIVLTVIETWSLSPSGFELLEGMDELMKIKATARRGAARVKSLMPEWEVEPEVSVGCPASSILEKAEAWNPDLIVVGSHGYNALERLWLGSVSRAVTSHAKCSVEVALRSKAQGANGKTMRILLAVDGSEFSDAAVEEIANRPWPHEGEVHVISVIHLPFTLTPETWALPDSYYFKLESAERERAEAAINRAIARLRESNAGREIPLTLTSEVIVGHPEMVVMETAKKWNADLVALGSHGYRGFTRFLLGSVSQAVASHAPCSVEIVRKPTL